MLIESYCVCVCVRVVCVGVYVHTNKVLLTALRAACSRGYERRALLIGQWVTPDTIACEQTGASIIYGHVHSLRVTGSGVGVSVHATHRIRLGTFTL